MIHTSVETYNLILNYPRATLTAYIAGAEEDMKYNYKRKAILICPGGAYAFCSNREGEPIDRKSTRLNSSHSGQSRMPSSA